MNANGTYTITIDDRDVELLDDMIATTQSCLRVSLADATAVIREQYVIARKLLELGEHSTFYADAYKDANELTDIFTRECHLLEHMLHGLHYIRTGKMLEKRLILDITVKKTAKAVILFRLATDEQTKVFKKAAGKENLTTICCGCHKATVMTKIKKCGACKAVQYCSLECQKEDWKKHKKNCCK